MNFWKTKLFAMIVIASFRLAFFASPTYAATASTATHQAVAHQLVPLVSGGGCTPANPAVSACISINGSALVVPDAYVNLSLGCPTEVDIIIWWYDGSYHSVTGADTASCPHGHITGHPEPIFSGAQFYWTVAIAYYSNGGENVSHSPNQYI